MIILNKLITLQTKIIEKGYKNYEIANLINLSEVNLSNIINGKHIPRVNIAIKISKILNTPVDILFKETLDNEKKALLKK